MADLNLSASPSSGGANPKASASKETPKLRMSPTGDHSPVSRTAGAIVGVVSVVALALAIFLSNPSAPTTQGTGTGTGTTASSVTPTGHTTHVSVGVDGMAFTPNHIEVPVGDRLIIDFTNSGDQRHDLVFETGVSSGSLASGETKELDLGVISGDVEGWCSLPGHREMGMTLHVQATGASSSSSSSSGTSASGSHAHHGHDHGQDAAAGPATPTALTDYAATIDARDPAAPPATNETERHYTFTVTEQTVNVTSSLTRESWTFNGDAPGPILRGHIGDTFHITLVNNGTMSHSLDFHAGLVAPAMAFNGVPFQYKAHPIQIKTNERVRVWVMDAGPNLATTFHVVGTQFDTVWREGAYVIRGGGSGGGWGQVLTLGAAEGGFVEFTPLEAGHYTFVNHALSLAEKGQLGVFEVTD